MWFHSVYYALFYSIHPLAVFFSAGEMGPEYERQAALYEDWLSKQAMYLDSRVKSFETQVNKLKRAKKTIQARQRVVSYFYLFFTFLT